MKIYKLKYLLSAVAFGATVGMTTSCVNDLNTIPLDSDELVSEVVFGSEIEAYEYSLAKIYAGLVIGGNAGGDSDQDVVGIDGGSQASFLRVLWNMQELASDIAHCCWNDPGIPDFNHLSWAASSPWIKGAYYRLFYQINLSNAFLRETTDDKLASRGCSEQVKGQIKTFRAEARFLRALMYMYALDLYRNVPFVDENSPIGVVRPKQIMKEDLFAYIESEMLACESDLLDPQIGFNDNYGHANKAAMWAALSRLYLNAETYVGVNKYTDCVTYSMKVIKAGYELEEVYGDVFKADNHNSKEMIFPLRYEGDDTMTWGGMTALLCWGASEFQAETNAKGGWQGVRAKSSLYKIFEKEDDSDSDMRKKMLRVEATSNIEITNEADFANNGIPVTKFYNVNKDGSMPPSSEAWIDYPLFRLGEVYLNLAEAVLRGGQGISKTEALTYMNNLRKRAYSDKTLASVSESDFTLNFILDERARELFYEAQRRTDLIRFNKYTSGDYLWPWKGGVAEGRAVGDFYQVFPLPSDDIGSNENLVQNEGY
ncbi:RagB/SusD family nutrient uptake outer membrane protein [uncultured Bacteroides sp.]|uniref:RagB/SusD family nutrient uptake outer membrane protein n=1 Tax=uncultured Bacteroides sp. TaxID=162156 RepID=UPI00260D2386|nr:RagB/SusD family nutrient uptake outer membrane protein [uncultured Bacteroides sp.]